MCPLGVEKKHTQQTQLQKQIHVHINEDGTVNKEVTAPKINTLVYEGGGVRGLAYVGGTQALYEAGVMQTVKRVAGSSAGALTAVVVALGYSQEKIDQIISGIDMGALEDSKYLSKKEKVIKLKNKGYLNEGNKLLDLVRSVIRDRVIELTNQFMATNPDKIDELVKLKIDFDHITFKNLSDLASLMPEANIKDIFITGTRLGKDKSESPELVIFNAKDTPDMEIALAARISASIPIYFQPIIIDGHKHVDGGCLSNFPVHYFEKKEFEPDDAYKFKGASGQNLSTFGLKIDTQQEMNDLLFSPDRSKSIKERLLGLVEQKLTDTITQVDTTAANKRMEEEVYWLYSQRTCQVFDRDIGMVNFNMTEDEKSALKYEGYKNVSSWTNQYLDGVMEAKKYPSFSDMCEAMDTTELQKFCDALRDNHKEILILHNPKERYGSPTDVAQLQMTASKILERKLGKQKQPGELTAEGEAYKRIKLALEVEINKLRKKKSVKSK